MEKEEIEPQSYTATNELRWTYKILYFDEQTCKKERILQQLWQGSKGHQKWEDVPTNNKN